MRFNGEELEYVWHDEDWNGIKLTLWKGRSLRDYPPDIAVGDAVFYVQINDSKPYRFKLKNQVKLMNAVLSIVVRPERRREKAQLFIDEANRHIK